jgi:hypothetical protein
MIVLKTTHSPSRDERLDEYLINLSNHIERCVIDGKDPRSVMRDVARRTSLGESVQVEMINRFRSGR